MSAEGRTKARAMAGSARVDEAGRQGPKSLLQMGEGGGWNDGSPSDVGNSEMSPREGRPEGSF